jgi:hypothetical protein
MGHEARQVSWKLLSPDHEELLGILFLGIVPFSH